MAGYPEGPTNLYNNGPHPFGMNDPIMHDELPRVVDLIPAPTTEAFPLPKGPPIEREPWFPWSLR